ncbi:MAG: hypothetical protein VYC50_00420 [Pseudomonadota bacterium]|nr:hypothetical protein [Pseudomonadota bacterium]
MKFSSVFFLILIFFTNAAYAQYGTGTPTDVQPRVLGDAPIRDLSGVWVRTPRRLSPENAFISGSTFTPEPPKLTEYGQELLDASKNSNAGDFALVDTNDPVLTKCYPPGLPRVYLHPYPFQFVNTDKEIIILYEYDHTVRRVYIDGRPNLDDPPPLWNGNSVGQWTDDYTFVITTVGIDERAWVDRSGIQHSDQLKITETFTIVDNLNLTLDILMEDPLVFEEPWEAERWYITRTPEHWEISEISCAGDYLNHAAFEAVITN